MPTSLFGRIYQGVDFCSSLFLCNGSNFIVMVPTNPNGFFTFKKTCIAYPKGSYKTLAYGPYRGPYMRVKFNKVTRVQ